MARVLNNLAFLAHSQKQYEKAEPLYQRSLRIYKQSLGAKHPFVTFFAIVGLASFEGRFHHQTSTYVSWRTAFHLASLDFERVNWNV